MFSPQAHTEEILKFRRIGNDKELFALGQRYLQDELDSSYDLYEDVYNGKSKAQIIKEVVRYIRTDLNRDGVPEVFLRLEIGSQCGTAGCSGVLLQRRNGAWREVYLSGMDDSITLLDEWDGQYRRVQSSIDYEDDTRVILRWEDNRVWEEVRDKNGNAVAEYLRHPQSQPTPQE